MLGQLAFGAASFLSPMLYSYLVTHMHTDDVSVLFTFLNEMVPENLKWVSLYWVFAVITFTHGHRGLSGQVSTSRAQGR